MAGLEPVEPDFQGAPAWLESDTLEPYWNIQGLDKPGFVAFVARPGRKVWLDFDLADNS